MFGWLILKDRGKASLDMRGSPITASPFLAGVITSASNPYFWIWWLSAGSSLIMEGLKTGLIAAGEGCSCPIRCTGAYWLHAGCSFLLYNLINKNKKPIFQRLNLNQSIALYK
ncbi:MAG: LysE family transporter [Candidatus Methanoperedens sp.]|nr:LysE family transporter [Candidatus Methanoperedens sp.]